MPNVNVFNIDQKEIVSLTNKLEMTHKSALPLAVRSTLNDAAFEARKESLRQFRKNFIVRIPTFIRSHTIVNKSPNTFDIDLMYSETGIPEGKSKSGDNLSIQEFGGNISGRDVPTTQVRIGESEKGLISKGLYKRVWQNKPKGRIYRSGESTIIKTDKALLRVIRGGIWKILYLFDRNVKIDEKPYLEPAGRKIANLIPAIFVKRAKQRIEKYWSKK